ncbi:MAG: N-acetylmuramate alpha-1-phosphate uridylyltransferase MurU [Pseudomonadota bacterium]
MKAMILAAGKGERMRPLTLASPKPLLEAGGKPLIVHHIERLRNAGFTDIVINTAYLGIKIQAALGMGQALGVNIQYSHEGATGLETAGGMQRARPLLGTQPFLLVNADVWTDYPFDKLPNRLEGLAHLVMVDNPEHNPSGDFSLQGALISNQGLRMLTYSGIAIIAPDLLKDAPSGTLKLAPLLRRAADESYVTGEHHKGTWDDIGTPERLMQLNARFL